MRRNILLLLLLIAICAFSFQKGLTDAVPDFHSVHMTDAEAYPLGSTGTQPDDDYQMEDWEEHIYHFFGKQDTQLIAPNGDLPQPDFCSFYPNPCGSSQFLDINIEQPVNLSMVVIDSLSNVHYRQSADLSGGNNRLTFNYRYLNPGQHYRVYYGLSYKDHPFYYRAHADFIKM